MFVKEFTILPHKNVHDHEKIGVKKFFFNFFSKNETESLGFGIENQTKFVTLTNKILKLRNRNSRDRASNS